MLLSEAKLEFPAIYLNESRGTYGEADESEITAEHAFILKNGLWLECEIFDSSGRSFRVVGVRKLGRLGPAWKWWLPEGLSRHIYEIDLELAELPPMAFEQVLARVVELEKYSLANFGLAEDDPDYLDSLYTLRQCRSIADIVSFSEQGEIPDRHA